MVMPVPVSERSPSYYPVTGRVGTHWHVFDRLPLHHLREQHPCQWALFIIGFAYIQGAPITFPGVVHPPLRDSVSFMEIASIHGKPYREWPGDKKSPQDVEVGPTSEKNEKDIYDPPSQFGGYCHHHVVTFPSWHRPYVMLIEQAIGEHAENIAQQIENAYPAEKGRWIDAAKKLRFPYWDWADPKVTEEGVMSLLLDEEVSICAPGKNAMMVANPLASFKFPYIPRDFQDGDRNGSTAYFSKWKKTVRHPYSSPYAKSNIDELQAVMKQRADGVRRCIGMLFMFPDDGSPAKIYDEFSNICNRSAQAGEPNNIGSMEDVHNTIHATLGGNGNMVWPDYAAFDPVFFVHHSNMDRLLALWEWCYPDYWMGERERGTDATVHSQETEDQGELDPLVPFRHPDGTYWTSKETRFLTPDTYPKYYSYPEFLGIKVEKAAASVQERQEARARIAKYYGVDLQTDATKIDLSSWKHITAPCYDEVKLPSKFRPIPSFRVFRVFVRLYEHAIDASYSFSLYYKAGLVGSTTVFTREENSPCKACTIRRENLSVMRGVITIPSHIIDEVISKRSDQGSEKTLNSTLNDIAHALSAKLVDASGRVFASARGGDTVRSVPAHEAASRAARPVEVALISAAVAEHSEDEKQPVHLFDWQRHMDPFPSGWKEEPCTRDMVKRPSDVASSIFDLSGCCICV